MLDEIAMGAGTATLLALSAASRYFNGWVNRRHEQADEVTDGETATWVAIGTGYTIIGAAIITSLWAHRLPHDWTLGPVVGLILLVCFVFSGLPMWIGDRSRSHALRVARDARRKLGGE